LCTSAYKIIRQRLKTAWNKNQEKSDTYSANPGDLMRTRRSRPSLQLVSRPLLTRTRWLCTSNTDNQSLQPPILPPQSFTFSLEFIHSHLQLFGLLLQCCLTLLLLHAETGRGSCVSPPLIFRWGHWSSRVGVSIREGKVVRRVGGLDGGNGRLARTVTFCGGNGWNILLLLRIGRWDYDGGWE